ncbi:MAG: TetR family transcriptional regulator [Deltaproteobacteria bacterium]|nr:TetR family transcriptional regulator [Deltaproteobacteria bacterium]
MSIKKIKPGKRAVTEEQKAARLHMILDKALNLFARCSLDQVSMELIADKMGLAKGTLYLYFKSKEELFWAIKERAYREWFEKIGEKLKGSPKPEDVIARIGWFAKIVCNQLKEKKDVVRLITSAHHLLESGIDPSKIVEANENCGRSLLDIGRKIERTFGFLKEGQGVGVLLHVKAAIIGLQHVTEPAPLIRELIRKQKAGPELRIFQLSFEGELSLAIQTHLLGLKCMNEKIPGISDSETAWN